MIFFALILWFFAKFLLLPSDASVVDLSIVERFDRMRFVLNAIILAEAVNVLLHDLVRGDLIFVFDDFKWLQVHLTL